MPRLFVSCGEVSGDLYAGELIAALKAKTEIDCFGLGGPAMRAAGAELAVHMDDISVIGLVEVVGKIPALRRAMSRLVAACEQRRPDVAVLIDFSGFNLRLGRRLRALDIPIIYYVSPQVWAWREGRVSTIRSLVEKMLVLLPFEEAFYRERGVPVQHVGHPLLDRVQPRDSAKSLLVNEGLREDSPYLVVLPGSRRRELELHGPILAETLRRLNAEMPELQFLVSRRSSLPASLYRPLSQLRDQLPLGFFDAELHTALAHARAAIVASGTATLDAALCGTAMIVVYRIGWLSYLLGRPFVRVPHFAMVNLIAGHRLVPELVQSAMRPEKLVQELVDLMGSDDRLSTQRVGFDRVRKLLGSGGASARAAAEVLEVVAQRQGNEAAEFELE